jgi:hypothetical protein
MIDLLLFPTRNTVSLLELQLQQRIINSATITLTWQLKITNNIISHDSLVKHYLLIWKVASLQVLDKEERHAEIEGK